MHDPAYPRDLRGVTEVIDYVEGFRESFPDFRVAGDELLLTDDRVVARLTLSGTHGGAFMGVPPTDREFSVPAIAIHRFRKGQLAEEWVVYDALGVLRQLGVVPMSTP